MRSRATVKTADVAREIDAIKANLSDILDRVSRVTSNAGGNLRDGLASEFANARTRLSERADDVVGNGRDWLETELNSGVSQARGAVQRNPFAGLAIAAGIGFLVGLTSRSR